MFSVDEFNEYVSFIKDNALNIMNYKIGKLIETSLNLFSVNFNNFQIYIDNVKNKAQFDIINNFIKNYILNVFVFIQISKNTLDLLSNLNFEYFSKSKEKNYRFSDGL